jgi:hypothetical protein
MLRFGVAVKWIHDASSGVYSVAPYLLHYFNENAQVWRQETTERLWESPVSLTESGSTPEGAVFTEPLQLIRGTLSNMYRFRGCKSGSTTEGAVFTGPLYMIRGTLSKMYRSERPRFCVVLRASLSYHVYMYCNMYIITVCKCMNVCVDEWPCSAGLGRLPYLYIYLCGGGGTCRVGTRETRSHPK